jgi:hypothetical protein
MPDPTPSSPAFSPTTQARTVDSFEIRGGSITLTRTNHNRTSGLFELRAERTSPADGAQLSINGTFDAGQIPQVFPLPE